MMLILNKRNDKIPSGAVYVGRPSIYGNKFEIGKDGTRDEVVEKYREWFQNEMKSNALFRKAIESLKDVPALICWCAPLRCHAEIIRDYLVN